MKNSRKIIRETVEDFLRQKEFSIWFSENGFQLTALRHAELLNPADIECMALDALAKSLFYYKSDLLQAINTLILESVAYIELPDGFKEKYKEEVEKRKSRCRNHDDYCDDF